ncbi:MAG: hypothetical protein RML45_11805 [Acetobacteraceae bacterium]|nr:hypothetical protein [Acetobacteraceae bacterium]
MGDEDEGEAEPFGDGAHVALQGGAREGIEGGEGLVEHQEVGFDGERAGEGDTLLLTAREVLRVAVGEGGEPDEVEQAGDLLPPPLTTAEEGEPEPDVAGGGEPRQQAGLLEHHDARGVGARHAAAVDVDRRRA